MSSESPNADAAAGEEHLIDRVIDRLALDWPEFDEKEIARTVEAHRADFKGSVVRDYVPVLVERAADQDLSDRSTASRGDGHGPLWTREAENA